MCNMAFSISPPWIFNIHFSFLANFLCRSIIYYKYIPIDLQNSRTVSKLYLEIQVSSYQNSSLIIKMNNQENRYKMAFKQIVCSEGHPGKK